MSDFRTPVASPHPAQNSAKPQGMSQNAPECPTFESENAALTSPSELPPLKPRQAAALNLLLTGSTDTAVAAALNLDRKTLYRWRTTPGPFRTHLDHARQALFDESAGRLAAALPVALDQFLIQLEDENPVHSHRAATSLLRISNLGSQLAPKHPNF